MKTLSKLTRLNLRDIWAREASDFTPWLADNIEELGSALGMDLELEAREASVGDFSLDLLAKDLGTGRKVVIENQLNQTDHDHLGKLLTYAAGFDASVVIWVAETIREEHRQALEWLNQKTDTETEFFAVVIVVMQIEDSKPAYDFRPVVFPNEWQKSKRSQSAGRVTTRGEAYRRYFQALIDELREQHKFTEARIGQPASWYAFRIGTHGVTVGAAFSAAGVARVELYIDGGDHDENKALFDGLLAKKNKIEAELGFSLQWDRLDGKRASRIWIGREGTIAITDADLDQIRAWHVEQLLRFKRVFAPRVKGWRLSE